MAHEEHDMGPAPIFSGLALVFFVVAGLSFISFVVSPFVATAKGYAPYFWLFASGPIGLIVICYLPSAKNATTPEQMELMQARANTTGAILTGVALLVVGMLLVPVVLIG